MAIPSAERPPRGLDARWLAVWRHALKTLKEQGTWAWEQRPLLDEYLYALKAAEEARHGFRWLDSLEQYAAAEADDLPEIAWTVLRQIAQGLPTQWDKHTKRASALADQLLLTPRGRKAAGMRIHDEDDEPADPFSALDADELAPRRQNRAAGA